MFIPVAHTWLLEGILAYWHTLVLQPLTMGGSIEAPSTRTGGGSASSSTDAAANASAGILRPTQPLYIVPPNL